MSLRGHILESTRNWRSERAILKQAVHAARTSGQRMEALQASAITQPQPKPLWTRADFIFNFLGFCCLVVVVAALVFVALCFLSAAYPATTCAAMSILGLCN